MFCVGIQYKTEPIILEYALRLILGSESHSFRLNYPRHTCLDLNNSSLLCSHKYYCISYQLLHDKVSQNLVLKTAVNIYYIA